MMEVWKIEVYEGRKLKLSETTSRASFTNEQMTALLQRLASRDLSAHEIINASREPNSVGYSPALAVNGSLDGDMLSISTSARTYTARAEKK